MDSQKGCEKGKLFQEKGVKRGENHVVGVKKHIGTIVFCYFFN